MAGWVARPPSRPHHGLALRVARCAVQPRLRQLQSQAASGSPAPVPGAWRPVASPGAAAGGRVLHRATAVGHGYAVPACAYGCLHPYSCGRRTRPTCPPRQAATTLRVVQACRATEGRVAPGASAAPAHRWG